MALNGDLPNVRMGRVVQVRAQLDAGTYESPEKIRVTASRLLGDIT